jgi:hypothetical protein
MSFYKLHVWCGWTSVFHALRIDHGSYTRLPESMELLHPGVRSYETVGGTRRAGCRGRGENAWKTSNSNATSHTYHVMFLYMLVLKIDDAHIIA